MFDFPLPDVDELAHADDAALVMAITECARVEAAAAARRLAATAELVGRHAIGPTDCAYWSCDNWDAMAAEVAAAQGISHSMASGQMYLAVALRNRVPEVAALFVDGKISARLAATIVWRTDLIKDPETLRLVDATLAEDAARDSGRCRSTRLPKPSTMWWTVTTRAPCAAPVPARVAATW